MIINRDVEKTVIERPRITKTFPLLAGMTVGGSFTINGQVAEEFSYLVEKALDAGKILRADVVINFVEDVPVIQEKVFLNLPMSEIETETAIRNGYRIATLEEKVKLNLPLTEEETKAAFEKGLIKEQG